jgi:hypothetical protein
MKLPAGKIHIRHFRRRVENVELTPDSGSVLRRNAPKIA